jgi:hypothetical protein
MAFIRNCVITAVMACCIVFNAAAQKVYYPFQASQLLKSTTEDVATLLKKAVNGSTFVSQAYTAMPVEGVIFIYDTAITDYQACKVQSDGKTYIKFTAAGDNGLHFGVYQYLYQQGYRFYQPGTIWEITPELSSAYKKTDTVYTCDYKYKGWFISGGHNRWVMDNNAAYGWDTYFGDNGHNWALYQRRNGMLGSSTFNGHRDDIMRGDYMAALQNNPCYVANYNGSRQATSQSVPDIYSPAAQELWANAIEKKFTQYKNTIYGNQTLYTNIYRNFKYTYNSIGIEVPDGSKWGNSKDNDVCSAVDYPKESDQHFKLANFTAQKILAKYPGMRFQLYAYSGHADVPSSSIVIDKNIDIQLVPTVYQMESSTNGLRNRWYNRSKNISEYLYLNLSGWSGETPSFRWKDIKSTLEIARTKKSQGIMWETSPAKFGSLLVLLACNNYLKENIEVDSTLHEFCNNMFGNASNTIYKLFQTWGDGETMPDKYTMELYLGLLNTADQQTKNASEDIKQRVRELKAYVHYMVLYFDLAGDDQDKSNTKATKDAALCMYLAKINKLQLVNSYYIIGSLAYNYGTTSDFYAKYNVINGSAYQNGNLPLITNAEIDNNFLQDVALYSSKLEQFKMEDAATIKNQFKVANIDPLSTINTKLVYTNGLDYYNKTTFAFVAPAAGSFTIKYTPTFEMAGKGFVNFTVESTDKALEIIKDFTIDNSGKAGALKVDVPHAGSYIMTIISKYKTSIELSIITNGNYFFKSEAFLGNKTESYRNDAASLPGYFYIPAGLSKIYCSVNSFSNGKYASADAINKAFDIKDHNGRSVQLRFVTPKDSSLMVLDIPENAGGMFWQVTNMAQYSLKFVTTSNLLWYASRKTCTTPEFTISVVNKNGNCITRLTTTEAASGLTWSVNDKSHSLHYTNMAVVDLPDYITADAVITLTNAGGCGIEKTVSDDKNYIKAKNDCLTNKPVASAIPATPLMYPNPSTGIFNCMQNGSIASAEEITIYNTQGTLVGNFKNVKQFDISRVTAGIYVYRMVIKGEVYKGKVVKM